MSRYVAQFRMVRAQRAPFAALKLRARDHRAAFDAQQSILNVLGLLGRDVMFSLNTPTTISTGNTEQAAKDYDINKLKAKPTK